MSDIWSGDYRKFLIYFLIGGGFIVASNAYGWAEWTNISDTVNTILYIASLASNGIGLLFMFLAARHYLRFDLKREFEIDKWVPYKNTIEYFYKDRLTGDKVKIPVQLNQQLSKPDLPGDKPQIFTEGVLLENLGRAENKTIIYQFGREGDVVGPLVNNLYVTFIVLGGKVEQWSDDKSFVLNEGDTLTLEPNVERKTVFLEKSELIIVYEDPDDSHVPVGLNK